MAPVRVVDIASTNRNVLALDDEGNIYTWGSSQDGLTKVPEFTGEVTAVEAGYKHFILLLDDGSLVTWAPTSWARRICPRTWAPSPRSSPITSRVMRWARMAPSTPGQQGLLPRLR